MTRTTRTRRCVAGLSFVLGACAGVFACSSDDTVYPPTRDGGHDATLPPDGQTETDAQNGTDAPQGGEQDAGDAQTEADAGDAQSDDDGGDAGDAGDGGDPDDAGDAGDAGEKAWLLLSLGGGASSEMVAYNLATRTVDGRLPYAGFGTTDVDPAATQTILWNMEQQNDVVRRLDPNAPWLGGPAWNVRLNDRPDGGNESADPVAVVSGPAGKSYVLRFNRNALAVIDPEARADASVPIKSIDLSRFVESVDGDGRVDMAGAVYLAARRRLYVLLGNIDLTNVAPGGGSVLCNTAKPRIVEIDVDTDTVVTPPPAGDGGAGDAGDGGARDGLVFDGYNPVFNGLVYDAPRARFLVLSAGCNEGSVDAGVGPLRRRQIDAIDPNTGRTETVLDLTARAYPLSRAQTDATHWALGFGTQAYLWDVTTRALGDLIPNAPPMFVYDGRGSLVGTMVSPLADGGSQSNIVSVPLAGGSPTTLGPVPFSSAGQYLGGLDPWSR